MILEVAILDVKAERTVAFETAFRHAQCIIAASPGYLSHELQRCVEKPNRYLLLAQTRRPYRGIPEIGALSGVEAAIASLLRSVSHR
jgi:hypothetical protein